MLSIALEEEHVPPPSNRTCKNLLVQWNAPRVLRSRLCKARRSAAVKFPHENVCVEIAMENAVKLLVNFGGSSFLRKRSSKVPIIFQQISRYFSSDSLQLQRSTFVDLVARTIRNAIRANRFARIVRNRNPYFYSASGRFARITRISDSREPGDRANRFARITPLSLWSYSLCGHLSLIEVNSGFVSCVPSIAIRTQTPTQTSNLSGTGRSA